MVHWFLIKTLHTSTTICKQCVEHGVHLRWSAAAEGDRQTGGTRLIGFLLVLATLNKRAVIQPDVRQYKFHIVL